MKVEIKSGEIVKPSSPTPLHLRIYRFSLFDQLTSGLFIPILYFYSNTDNIHGDRQCTMSEISDLLKKSLSETLTHYYILAGRIKDGLSIDCNDEGAMVMEARIKCELSEILKHPPNGESLKLLFPNHDLNLPWNESNTSIPLFIQINFFDCGGVAVALCMSHKIGDVLTIVSFMNHWAAIARNSEPSIPELTAASVFPQGDLPNIPETKIQRENCVITRRFVFEPAKLASLKAAAMDAVKNPTRVEVVSALIYKSIIFASRANSAGSSSKPTVLLQTVNLRKRVEPPLPENFVGNLAWFFPVRTTGEEKEIEISTADFVRLMRDGLVGLCENYAKNLRGEAWPSQFLAGLEELGNLIGISNQDVYSGSSWCRFPLYEADFGWGKPIWVTSVFSKIKNSFFLMDARDGDGIEAFVALEEEDMAVFECNEELLAFARKF